MGRQVTGRGTKLLPTHAFIQLEPCVEVVAALAGAPKLSPGQEVTVEVTAVSPQRHRLEVILPSTSAPETAGGLLGSTPRGFYI